MINVAKFNNAVIDIYGESTKGSRKDLPQKNRSAAPVSGAKTQQPPGVIFKDVFRKESLPSFPVGRVMSIVMEPIVLKLHDDKSQVTQISATSGTIRLKQRDIFFTGDVRVKSGGRVLRTDRLRLMPERAIIQTERHYKIKTPEYELEGDQLITDITLHPVEAKIK